MSKFGYNYQEVEVEDEYITGKCVYCGKETDLILEHGDRVKIQIPVCKKHYEKIKPKIKSIEYNINQLIHFITA